MDIREGNKNTLLARKKKNRRRAARRKQLMLRLLVGVVCVVVMITGISLIKKLTNRVDRKKPASEEVVKEETKEEKIARIVAEADLLALSYDYDTAIELLKTIEEYETNETVQEAIKKHEDTKASCVPVKIEEVTHIFYHSLVVDPARAFANQDTNPQAVGNNQWMTTVEEFNKITQEMYDRGYAMVSIHDLYDEVQDENGNTVFQPAEILLPPGKKAFVLSLDDLSYYHAYEGYGYAAKLILDKDGKVVNEYIDANGETLIGDYDVVPLMDRFVEKHPDASYRGAKGIIALTGYNGVLGYRSDETYDLNNPNCDIHQQKWIETHEGFDLQKEIEGAKKVADAMKANGWEFASHTWGHLRVGQRSLESLKADNERWKKNIEPIVGPTDTIIFAHGEDLQAQGEYDQSNAKYQYFRSEGYSIFCNVDSHQYATLIAQDYMRQGRRNLDGYRIYYNAIGSQNNVSDLFDAKAILDPLRPPVPEL